MEKLIVENKDIKDMIYEIRGKQVMLDSDLAKLYECANGTKDINKAVKRNIERFPEDFYFQLDEKEFNFLRFQSGTSKTETRGGRTYLPYVFTEQGVAMLASVLKTEKASEVSVNIMRVFVSMRKFINSNADMFKRMINVEYTLLEHDDKINQILNEMNPKEFKEKLFYDGQIYDAYSLLIDIIREAKKKIIIIDNYIDKTILDILLYKNENIKVIIYTKSIKSKLDIEKFNLQYPNVAIKYIDNFHDRFIIIDDNTLYHIGASLKDLGKKCFAISKLDVKFIPTIEKFL